MPEAKRHSLIELVLGSRSNRARMKPSIEFRAQRFYSTAGGGDFFGKMNAQCG
jgi:hypothetical protein